MYTPLGFEKGKAYLQIDNGEPFLPDVILSAGVMFGRVKKDNPKGFQQKTQVAVVDYQMDGFNTTLYARDGKWKAHESGKPMFCIYGLLE
jgi:hypothetical protein